MCILLTPASFLAVAFRELKKIDLDYRWLNKYRVSVQEIKSPEGRVDVSWDHDSVNYAMGFYSPVFTAKERGIRCNLKVLERYYKEITMEMGKDLLKSVQMCARSCGKTPAKSCGMGKKRKIIRVCRQAH